MMAAKASTERAMKISTAIVTLISSTVSPFCRTREINRATWDGGSVNFWAEGLFGDKFPVEQSIKVGRCSYGFFCLT